jgi:hypothetical protein
MSVNFYDVLKSSYKSKNQQKNTLGKNGYLRDDELSNDNQQVYYHPNDKKLIFSITGTHNLKDWGTNAYLAVGKLKDTNRYKEAHATIRKAKEKYNPSTTTVTGHSLANAIASGVSSKDDKVVTLDGAYTIGQKTRGNTTHYRTKGDIVSAFGANAKHTVNLDNKIKTGIGALDAYNAHNVDNIKNEKIFI